MTECDYSNNFRNKTHPVVLSSKEGYVLFVQVIIRGLNMANCVQCWKSAMKTG